MKMLDRINKTLDSFADQYGVRARDVIQGSPEWHTLRLGVVTSSNAHKAVAARASDTRLTYMAELVAQVCTGLAEEINAKQLAWGKDHEPEARAFFAFENKLELELVGFAFKDEDFREGCSADCLIESLQSGAEFKCPFNSANFIKFLTADKIKSEWEWQYQHTMRVTGTELWHFGQYDPRMLKTKMRTIEVKRDKEKQKVFEDTIPIFIEDMDKMLERAGVKFGDQWVRLAKPAKAVS